MSNKESKKYVGWIYKISNDINDKLYIGQTVQLPKKRFYQHCIGTKCKNNNMLLPKAINKYGSENFHMDILEEFRCESKEELRNILNKAEVEYIANYNTCNPNGYNITKGGEFVSDKNCTQVDQYTIDGEFLKSWDSMTEAGRMLKFSDCGGHITAACAGDIKTAYGFVWRYKGEPFEIYNDKFDYNSDKTEIYCFDLDGNLLKKYESKAEIRRDYGICVNKVLNDPNHQLRDRWWSTEPIFRYLGRSSFSKIDLYDNLGNFIRTFECGAYCGEYLGLSSGSEVIACCNGRVKVVAGHVARYHGDSFDRYDIKTTNEKKHFAVDVYDINKQYICSFDEAIDVAILDGMNEMKSGVRQAVKNCCDGKFTNYRGYIFKYKGDDVDLHDTITKMPIGSPINQYDLNGNYIRTFNGSTDAVNYFGEIGVLIKGDNITNTCKGRQKSAYNFKWYYAHDLSQPDPSRIRTRLNQTNPRAIEYIKNQKLSQAS